MEDDPYGELRYRGDPVPPLAAYGERVLYLGSLSKIGAPGLRLGWLRAPRELMAATVIAKQAADLHTSTIDQAAAAMYLSNTDLNAHVAGLCAAYRERRDTMVAPSPPPSRPARRGPTLTAACSCWLRLPGDVDTADVLRQALTHNVAFVPGAPFFATTPDPATFRMSFTTNPPRTSRKACAGWPERSASASPSDAGAR